MEDLRLQKSIKKEKNQFIKRRLEQRLAMLSGSVGLVKVGADSKVELKEKKDRIEDAIYAVKAALKEGIVPGGGVALLDAVKSTVYSVEGEKILAKALLAPFKTILENAGLDEVDPLKLKKGWGIDVTCGCERKMIDSGIIDPVLVTKIGAQKRYFSSFYDNFSRLCNF